MACAPPKKKYEGQNTDFKYYSDKYEDYWELRDSTYMSNDTIYIYQLGGQKFKFNQNGRKV